MYDLSMQAPLTTLVFLYSTRGTSSSIIVLYGPVAFVAFFAFLALSHKLQWYEQ